MLTQEFTPLYPPLQVRAGVLVVDGFGVKLRVARRGKLCVEDGLGRQRRSIVLDRAGSGLERLVLIGKTGFVTLEALAWLRAIGAAFVQIGRDGELLAHSVPFGYDGLPIRRAQGLAATNGFDLVLARELIDRKLDGQRRNLARLKGDLPGFDGVRGLLKEARSIEQVRRIEAQAAAIYWSAWNAVRIQWRPRDLARMPSRWARYDSRASVLTGAPRASIQPVNSILNYLYACLESEARLALLVQGLDPTLGVLHADQRNRDSFALDAMEPIRPEVDAFVLDLLEDRTFTSRDFAEVPNGVCRLGASLTHDLALTLPHWRMLAAPIAAGLAQAFRTPNSHSHPFRVHASHRPNGNPARKTPIHSPLDKTPRTRSQQRPYASEAWGTARPEGLAANPVACVSCGEPVLKRRRRYCEECLPKARRARGLRAIEAARKALAAQAAAGKDPRSASHTNAKRASAIAEAHRRNRDWRRENGKAQGRDQAWFLREVTPKLEAFSLSELAAATGLSLAACSRFRAGARVPHPRHWNVLRELVRE